MALSTLRLHKAMYMQQAVRDAVRTFEDFATLKMGRDGDHYTVEILAVDPEVEGDLAGELANFALIHTLERKRKTPGQ